MSDATDKLFDDLCATAAQAGIGLISFNSACQILAWLLHFGGGNEDTVFNPKLNRDIKKAQSRMNVYGGEIPNGEFTPLLQAYARECKYYLDKKIDAPEWLALFSKKYGVELDRE